MTIIVRMRYFHIYIAALSDGMVKIIMSAYTFKSTALHTTMSLP